MTEMQRFGVVGAGMMGTEIALCFAKAGFEVALKEVDEDLAQKGKARIRGLLEKACQKGKLAEDQIGQILARLKPTTQYNDLSHAGMVVEAVTEELTIKAKVFDELDLACGPQCILATNTSSIPITQLASYVRPPRRRLFVGTHFFSPASIMRLVEVIPGLETQEATVSQAMEICRVIGKTPIRVKDVTGFVVNRILHAMWIEANHLLEEEVASAEDIDIACKLGLGHPIGPYALMDLTGNDLNLMVQQILHESYGERFRPRPILKNKVYAGHLGRKSGKGWYGYDE